MIYICLSANTHILLMLIRTQDNKILNKSYIYKLQPPLPAMVNCKQESDDQTGSREASKERNGKVSEQFSSTKDRNPVRKSGWE